MSGHRMPAAEVEVSPELVRRLLAEQHPDLASLPVEVLANGWDNLVCRLGEHLIARLPRRAAAVAFAINEQRWLPVIAPRLPLPVPAPVRLGGPGQGYPWPWSIVPYLPGEIAALAPPAGPRDAAARLGRFLAALHAPAPADAPASPYRGIPLADRGELAVAQIEQLSGEIDTTAVRRVWETATTAPAWGGPPAWLHGDFHPANIVVAGGRVSAVIDFGDVTSGDPATDLSVAWMLLPADCRAVMREAYARAGGPADGEADWLRARGWALAFALVFMAHSADNPLMARIGRRAMDAVLSGS